MWYRVQLVYLGIDGVWTSSWYTYNNNHWHMRSKRVIINDP